MADRFGANPETAGQMSDDLARARSAMKAMGGTFDRYEGAVGSSRIEDALDEFFTESSDNRDSMDGLLKRASGLLRKLDDGTGSVDTGLAGALTPSGSTGQPARAGGR